MATVHSTTAARPVTAPMADSGGPAMLVDRWICVFTAGLVMVIVLVGFIPDSITLLEDVEAGRAPPIPPILHVHAILMGAWITLLLAQTVLMATGRPAAHMLLGRVAFLLAPAVVVAGFLLVPTRRAQVAALIAEAPADVALRLQTEVVPFINNIMLVQVRTGIVFSILVALALYFRRRDSATHKRLMFLAVLAPLPAAISRMTFLPHSLPESPLTIELYPLLVIAPMFLWDWYRQRRIQRAYVIWAAIVAPLAVVTTMLWNSPAWHGLAGQVGGLG